MNDNASAFCTSKYDEEIRKVLPYYEDFYKQVVDIVKVRFDRPLAWLDIGCGTGKMAEAAFKDLDIENFLFCDSSEDMIKIAKERFAGENSKYVVSSFPEMNEPGPFDVITAMMVFHYFTRERRKESLQNVIKFCIIMVLLLHLKILRRIVKQAGNCFWSAGSSISFHKAGAPAAVTSI